MNATPLKHILEYWALRALCLPVQWMPHRMAILSGWWLGKVGFAAYPRIRRRIMARLEQVLGSTKSLEERQRIACVSFQHFVLNVVESIRFPKLNANFFDRYVRTTDFGHLQRPYTTSGKGVVIAIPHLGNWEMAGMAARHLGVPVTTVMRRQKNLLVDRFLNRIREAAGLEVFPTDEVSIRVLLRRLEQGRCVALLPDLHAKGRGVEVRFLGHSAWLPVGMAFLAREAEVPIIPMYTLREDFLFHRFVFFEPVHPAHSASRDEDLRTTTQAVIDILSRAILEHPDQYFWFNKRWVLDTTESSGT